MDTLIVDTVVAAVDTVVAIADTCCATVNEATEDTVEEVFSWADFFIDNWGELTIALLAFLKVVVNLTPTERDNAVFAWVDTFIDYFIPDRKKA